MKTNRATHLVLRLSPSHGRYAQPSHPPLYLRKEETQTKLTAQHVRQTGFRHIVSGRLAIFHAVAHISRVTLFPKLLGKIAAILLVPAIFFHPLFPLYAEELSSTSLETNASAGAAGETVITESGEAPENGIADSTSRDEESEAVPESPSGEETYATDETDEDAGTHGEGEMPNEEDSSSVPGDSSLDIPPTGEDTGLTNGVSPESDDEETIGEMGTSTAGTEDEGIVSLDTSSSSPEISSVPQTTASSSDVIGSSTPTDQTEDVAMGSVEDGTTTAEQNSQEEEDNTASVDGEISTASGDETATSSGENAATTSTSVSSGESSPATAFEISGDTPPDTALAESGPSFEERLSAELETRSAMLREEIRRQVEREWTSGCVALDGSGYYCLKYTSRNLQEQAGIDTYAVSSVSVRPGSGGDNEIFVMRGREDIQLSENDADDAFPAKDVAGTSVVWQSQEYGRWQIYLADMTKTPPAITRLTNGKESNFNPKVDGTTVVWQAWLDENWEVVMASRRSSPLVPEAMTVLHAALGVSGEWDLVRITNDPAHDMFPSIAGGLVTWQKNVNGTWGVWTHSIVSGASVQLSSEATASENPRFAMVWEERGEGGAVRLVGYDVARGEKVDLTSEARNIPDHGMPHEPVAPSASADPATLPAASSGVGASALKPDGDDGEGSGENDPVEDALLL